MNVISIDIETYGACLKNVAGDTLPEQTVFHPRRSVFTDRVNRRDLILSCAITLLETATCPGTTTRSKQRSSNSLETSKTPFGSWGTTSTSTRPISPEPSSPVSFVSSALGWSPGKSMVLLMHLAKHRKILLQWLRWADTLVGMNLQYDLLYLRYIPQFRAALDGRHRIVDVSVLNYLNDETRPERSLKAVGPVLGTHRYAETIGSRGRFDDPYDLAFQRYNASDTHNSILAVSELTRRIQRDFGPRSDKLSDSCLQFYSDTIWTVIRMAEAGFCMDRWTLTELEERLNKQCLKAHRTSQDFFGLPLEGPGSGKAKQKFLELSCDLIDGVKTCRTPGEITEFMNSEEMSDSSTSLPSGLPSGSSVSPQDSSGTLLGTTSVKDNKLLQLTPKKGQISWTEGNRNLLASLLPKDHPARRVFRLAKWHASSQKLISSYTFPLLRHRRTDILDQSSVLIPIGGRSCHSLITLPTPLSSGGAEKMEKSTDNLSATLTSSSVAPTRTLSDKPTCPSKSPSTSFNKQSTSLLQQPNTLDKKTRFRLRKAGGPRKGMAYPSWYVTPSFIKEGEGAMGGTLQGRITCKKPSRQTFPSSIKSHLCSRRRDGVLVSFDLSQVELRVAALLSGDDALVSAFRLGTDLHSERAEQLFPGCSDLPEFKKFHRQVGKTVNFADLYLAGPDKLQETILAMTGETLPLLRCQSIVSARRAHRPGLCAWHAHLFEQVEARGYLELPFTGQSRFFNLPNDKKEVVNFPVQTTAGNTLLFIQHALHRTLPGINDRHPWVHMTSQVYDSVEFDCQESRVDDLKAHFEAAIEYVQRLGYWSRLEVLHGRMVPLEYDMEITS